MYHYFVRKSYAARRRCLRCRYKLLQVRADNVLQLKVIKTGRHFYAQVLSDCGSVLASSSTVCKIFRERTGLKLGKQNGVNSTNVKIVAGILSKQILDLDDYKSGSFCVLDRGGNRYSGVIALFKEELENNGIRFSRNVEVENAAQ